MAGPATKGRKRGKKAEGKSLRHCLDTETLKGRGNRMSRRPARRHPTRHDEEEPCGSGKGDQLVSRRERVGKNFKGGR